MLRADRVWAAGGNGLSIVGSPGGAGGVDGPLTSATGQDGAPNSSGISSSGGGGGGGAVDTTTGNGAPGGARGVYGTTGVVPGAAGATGGTGQVINAPTTISTTIIGGNGGAGAADVPDVSTWGGGGGGGTGVRSTADVTITGTGAVTGGSGFATANSSGGGGGVGVFSSASVTVEAGARVTGGAGGGSDRFLGGGGQGAAAIMLTNGGVVQNSGTLVGGAGGLSRLGGGGDGGAGVQMLTGGTVINTAGGTITGGAGGAGRTRNTGSTTAPGKGGVGVMGAGISIVNAGTISGGANASGGGQATAIQFTGGVNSLEIWAGSTISGNVVAYSAADTLKLGGGSGAGFDVSAIGAGGKYQGFGLYEKTGAGTWTLTGTTTAFTPWSLTGGILQISNDSSLGDPSGGLAFNGGTLETTATINSTRAVALIGNGTFLTDAGTTLTLGGILSGAGGLTKAGTGTMILTGDSSYTGGTTISAGTLQLGDGGTSGSIVGNVTNNGALVLNRSDTMILRGAISGSGTVSQVGGGTTVLTGDNSYTGGTTISAGTLQLGNGGTSGSIVGNVADNGTLAFNRSDTVTFGGVISGSGGVSQIGSGTTILNANNPYSGPTNVQAGTLVVGDASHASAALSGGGPVTVATSATLGGYGRVADDVDNFGKVAAGSAALAGGPFGSFTVSGNYTAHSTLVVNTLLNAGGPLANQFTDRLLILGNAGGHTTVQVKASGAGAVTGPPTATSGISLVQVAGTTSAGAFSLPSGTLVGGPYQYRLNAYGPGSSNGAADPGQNLVGNAGGYWDFRLQNAYVTPSGPVQPGQPVDPANARPALAPQVPAYISAPTALFSAGLLDIDQLHRRLGEIRDAQAVGLPRTAELFARGYGSTMTYTSTRSFTDYGIDASESYAAFQVGASGVVMNDDLGTLRLGLAGSYGKLQLDPDAPDGWSEGNVGVGKLSGIATFQARAGWYLDAIVTGGWFSGTIGTTAYPQAAALSGSMVGASLEGGWPIALGWRKLSVEPQVQVSWQHLMFDGTTDADSIAVKLGTLDQGVVRVGARLVRPFETDDGKRVTPYLKLNLLQGFADGGAINVGGVAFDTGQYGTAIQVGGGLTGMLTASLAVYGDVAWQHEVSAGGFRGWAFNGGLRYSF